MTISKKKKHPDYVFAIIWVFLLKNQPGAEQLWQEATLQLS